MVPADFPPRVRRLLEKFDTISEHEVRYEGTNLDDARLVIVAYGSVSRSALTALKMARREGIPVGLFRPITLYPFPYKPLAELTRRVDDFLVAELSSGQLIEDVRLAVGIDRPISLVNRYGGVPLTADDILEAIRKIIK
jgi:2-oxoglutarate ferredoxin oxidoreductase subunit alpha